MITLLGPSLVTLYVQTVEAVDRYVATYLPMSDRYVEIYGRLIEAARAQLSKVSIHR